jgi:glycosyltransferase involved in cell wall biosynthesis
MSASRVAGDEGSPESVVMLLSNPAVNDPRVQKEARALASAGYRVTVVAWDRLCDAKTVEEVDGYRVERIRVRSTYGEGLFQAPALLTYCLRTAPVLRRLSPSVIHCHDLETLPLGLVTSRLLGSRLVFDAHEPHYFADSRRLRWLATWIGRMTERAFAPMADAVLVTNDYQASKYESMKVSSLTVVANYPETNLVDGVGSSGGHGGDRASLTIGRVGALYYDMGIEELLEAYVVLADEVPGLKLMLAGQTTDAYRNALMRSAGPLRGDIRISGGYRYDELPALYRALDVCVLPQKKTLWFEHITPTKFFEALCFAKPVVTTDVGGIGKVVVEEGCGAVMDEVTADSICAALRPILKNADIRRSMGLRGLEAVKKRYNWSASVTSLLRAYDGVLEGAGGTGVARPVRAT